MPKNPPLTKLLTKASKLKQKDETWEATIQLGRIWITPHRNPAYRPHITLLTRPTGAILTSQIQQTPPTPSATDLFWLEGAIEGILTYYNHHHSPEQGRVQPAKLTLSVNTLGAKNQLKLRLPAYF